MDETTEDKKISDDLSRRDFLAASAQIAMVGAVLLTAGETRASTGDCEANLPKQETPASNRGVNKSDPAREEYIQFYLARTRIYEILNYVPNCSILLLKALHEAGIEKAGEVQERRPLPGVTDADWVVLHRWLDTLKREYRESYGLLKRQSAMPVEDLVRLRMQEVLLDRLPRFPDEGADIKYLKAKRVHTMAQYKPVYQPELSSQIIWFLQEWQERLRTLFEEDHRNGFLTPMPVAIRQIYNANYELFARMA